MYSISFSVVFQCRNRVLVAHRGKGKHSGNLYMNISSDSVGLRSPFKLHMIAVFFTFLIQEHALYAYNYYLPLWRRIIKSYYLIISSYVSPQVNIIYSNKMFKIFYFLSCSLSYLDSGSSRPSWVMHEAWFSVAWCKIAWI